MSKSKSLPLTPDQQGALIALSEAWTAEHDADAATVAPLSAVTVRRIVEAKKKGLTRERIAAGLNTSTGALSRHILIAKFADVPVEVGDVEYPNAVAALESGQTTLHALYAILNPQTGKRGGKTHKSLADAVVAMTKRAVRYREGKKTRQMKMLESRADWIAALTVLLEQPVGGLKPTTVESIVGLIPTTPEVEPVSEADTEEEAA